MGDFNFESCRELMATLSSLSGPERRRQSLNEQSASTNTTPNSDKPYDHAIIDRRFMSEAEIPSFFGSRREPNFVVLDFKEKMCDS